jgi:hypothetical protein
MTLTVWFLAANAMAVAAALALSDLNTMVAVGSFIRK